MILNAETEAVNVVYKRKDGSYGLIEQVEPRINGFPQVLTSFIISLFNPIANIAITIKNLLNSLSGMNRFASAPKLIAIVVIIDAMMKYAINMGNAFLKLNDFPSFFVFLACNNERINVIGMIANVLVNFTVTALSKVWVPRLHMLSHVAAAAVTEEVSLIAVPENMPNASPFVVEKPNIFPSIGNIIAARTLKKNIIEID